MNASSRSDEGQRIRAVETRVKRQESEAGVGDEKSVSLAAGVAVCLYRVVQRNEERIRDRDLNSLLVFEYIASAFTLLSTVYCPSSLLPPNKSFNST